MPGTILNWIEREHERPDRRRNVLNRTSQSVRPIPSGAPVPSITWPPLIRTSSITAARRLSDSQDRFAPGRRQRRKPVSPTHRLDVAKSRFTAAA